MTGSEASLSAIPTEQTDKVTVYLWLSFGICFFFNIFAGLISTLMSVYLPVVTRDLTDNISAGRLNNISAYINALYLAGWAVGGFLWGIVSDKIGRVKALALSAGTFGLFTVLISFATSWEMVVVCRLLSGLAVGGILVICPILLSEIWPARSRSVIIGIDSIGFPIGIFSSGLVNLLVPDWRDAFWVGTLPIAMRTLLKGQLYLAQCSSDCGACSHGYPPGYKVFFPIPKVSSNAVLP
jgi:MFS family permease